ncbi:malonyl CoA-acyl carrier protein transacylase [Streptomyces mashuensis]|uniref:[acyl-carrier-protein] S-malonyltransferase n=1 Tax=Streptomyces mashuensis TaxID=33904 RepID=A0A919B5W2_9ACTN|nr:ACP S-malonyltransferase [Streptomyces mashuensis]GHF52675.1 malonyl CoA-acyl carrier protein transacylase [Streptomyces mashuensis]
MTTADQAGHTAIVFPGMGPSRFAEVGRFLMLDPFARRRLAEADEALGLSVFDHFREATEDYSEFSQVAFLVNSMAMADRAEETLGIVPDFCAGPSFGQKAAAAYVGSLSFADVVRLTAELARCEEDFFRQEYTDVVTHSFLRVPDERLKEILAEFDDRGAWYEFSGFLDAGFHMLSVREKDLDGLKKRISDAGGYSMYSMWPPVHAPSFTALRRRAEEEVLSRYELADPRLPVVTDQDGTVIRTAAEMRTMLLDTFDRPINWPDVVRTLKDMGVSKVAVTGPDNLFHRLDCTKSAFEVVAVGLNNKRARERRA